MSGTLLAIGMLAGCVGGDDDAASDVTADTTNEPVSTTGATTTSMASMAVPVPTTMPTRPEPDVPLGGVAARLSDPTSEIHGDWISLFEGDLGYDRVNDISAVPEGEIVWIVTDVTSGSQSDRRRRQLAADAVFQLATRLWVPDVFGAVTETGSHVFGFDFTSDGVRYRLVPDAMIAVADGQVTAEQAMALSRA